MSIKCDRFKLDSHIKIDTKNWVFKSLLQKANVKLNRLPNVGVLIALASVFVDLKF